MLFTRILPLSVRTATAESCRCAQAVTGGDHAGNGTPVRGGVLHAQRPTLNSVNVDGNAIGLVGVIRFGNEARFTVPDTFTVDVQSSKIWRFLLRSNHR